VSSETRDPTKKHRHDVGQVDHGATSGASTTRSIQTVLALWVFLSLALVVFAITRMGPAGAP
jgi:hypothetical protein